ncbi:MAG: hypothetical protein AB8B87_17995 [Granulosicoccus sp.]
MFTPLLLEPETVPFRIAQLVFFCVPLCMAFQPAMAGLQKQHALKATIEHRFDPADRILLRFSVIVNANGYKLESLPVEHGQITIENFELGKTWLVDSNRSFIHEVPVNEVVDAPELDKPFISLPGFLDSIPCSFNGGARTGYVHFKGKKLERWRCTFNQSEDADDDELPIEQYYSNEYNLVVYSRSHSNIVSELVGISDVIVDRQAFTAPEGYRSVTIEQLMGESPPLGQYPEHQ